MTKKIKCRNQTGNKNSVRVRVIKAPIVDNTDLRWVITARARAIVL